MAKRILVPLFLFLTAIVILITFAKVALFSDRGILQSHVSSSPWPALEAAFETAQIKAKDGDIQAVKQLCLNENGFTKFEDQLAWCQKAMSTGDKEAAAKFKEKLGLDPQCGSQASKRFVDDEKKRAAGGNITRQLDLGQQHYIGFACISQDYAEAYFWLSVALKSNDKQQQKPNDADYPFWREQAAKQLTPEQKAAVEKRIQAWTPEPYTGRPDSELCRYQLCDGEQ